MSKAVLKIDFIHLGRASYAALQNVFAILRVIFSKNQAIQNTDHLKICLFSHMFILWIK